MSAKLVEGVAQSHADAVYLDLHGAMVTATYDDAEGELLQRLRAVVGTAVPILVSLDLHANVSPQMVERADFISSYRTYPHTDWGAAGARCADWLKHVHSWGPRAPRALRQCPFLVPVTTGCTLLDPARSLYRTLEAIESESGVHLSLNMGFPPADIRDVGPSVTAYGSERTSVERAADALFHALLACEADFAAHRPLPAAAAVAKALAIARTASRPVILADTQDNPGAGAPSSTTGLIAELLRQGAERAAVGILHDPESARAAHRLGIGGIVERLGGGAWGAGQEPLPGPWRVAALSGGRFKGTSPMFEGAETHMGPTALLSQDGVKVVAASIRQQPIHREVFSHLGVAPESQSIVALKSSVHFRAGYQDIAEAVIVCLAPGANLEDPAGFGFHKIRPQVRLRPRSDR
jgi:microcystin degradation protein MlrC